MNIAGVETNEMFTKTVKLAPVLYIPHGGGPLPLLGDPAHRQLVEFLKSINRLSVVHRLGRNQEYAHRIDTSVDSQE